MSAESTSGGSLSRWRWAPGAVVVLGLVLVYPVAHWLNGADAAAASARSAGAVQLSFDQYRAGRYQDAVQSAKAALADDPNLPEAYNNLAVSYLALHMFDEGIQAAENALRVKPDFELAKNNLAWIRREKARAAGPAAPATPAPADVLLQQSMQDYQAGRFRECIDAATQSSKLAPGSARAFNNIGICAGGLGLWDEAIRNTEEALRLDPAFQLARNNLAWIQQARRKGGASTPK